MTEERGGVENGGDGQTEVASEGKSSMGIGDINRGHELKGGSRSRSGGSL